MKILTAVLLCVLVSTPAMGSAPAPKGLVVCQTTSYVDELLIAVANDDMPQIKYLFRNNYCFEVKPGIQLSYAGVIGEDIYKVRAYTKDKSLIVYTHKLMLKAVITQAKGE